MLPQARMFRGRTCVSDANAVLPALALVFHMRRDVAPGRCVHANCENIAMRVGHSADHAWQRVRRPIYVSAYQAPCCRHAFERFPIRSPRGNLDAGVRVASACGLIRGGFTRASARSCSLKLAFTLDRFAPRNFLILLAWC